MYMHGDTRIARNSYRLLLPTLQVSFSMVDIPTLALAKQYGRLLLDGSQERSISVQLSENGVRVSIAPRPRVDEATATYVKVPRSVAGGAPSPVMMH